LGLGCCQRHQRLTGLDLAALVERSRRLQVGVSSIELVKVRRFSRSHTAKDSDAFTIDCDRTEDARALAGSARFGER
jgi:hypothetical protein